MVNSNGLLRVAAVGECMVELSRRRDGAENYVRSFAGDTLNTATYLARLTEGVAQVSYVTRLGDDNLSAAMLAGWKSEGIETGLVARVPGRLPGLYMIETSASGERSFLYWRENAPARELFDGDSAAVRAALLAMDLVYLSAITLAILPEKGRRVLLDVLHQRRALGLATAFDTNYRARLWAGPEAARAAMAEVMAACSLVFASTEDLAAIAGGNREAAAWLAWLAEISGADAVVKDGGFHVLTSTGRVFSSHNVDHDPRPVDTTGAGDSFNAGFLAAMIRGRTTAECVADGHRLARSVILFPGAIIAREHMP